MDGKVYTGAAVIHENLAVTESFLNGTTEAPSVRNWLCKSITFTLISRFSWNCREGWTGQLTILSTATFHLRYKRKIKYNYVLVETNLAIYLLDLLWYRMLHRISASGQFTIINIYYILIHNLAYFMTSQPIYNRLISFAMTVASFKQIGKLPLKPARLPASKTAWWAALKTDDGWLWNQMSNLKKTHLSAKIYSSLPKNSKFY